MKRELVLAAAVAAALSGATIALSRIFVDGSWRPSTFAAMLIALAIAAGARRVGFGAVASALASLVGLTVFVYVVHLPAGPLVPGREQLSQAVALFQTGLDQVRDTPAPTAPLDGLMFLLTTGVWVVAHVTHELLVRLRRPLLALLPPTLLWTVPLAVPLPAGRTWSVALPFLAGAVALLLAAGDTDVADWTSASDLPLISGAGATLGVVAIVLGILAPGVLPGYGSAAWWNIEGSSDPRGYQPIVDVGDRLKLPRERDVLEVHADRRLYLRLAALDTFDQNTWRLGPAGSRTFTPASTQLFRATHELPLETPIQDATPIFANVRVLDLENIYVPVPYQPVEVLGPERGSMVYSTVGGFVATGDTAENEIGGKLRVGVTEGFEYRVRSLLPTPSLEELRQVTVDPATVPGAVQLPHPYPRLAEEANRVYAAAGATTPVDKALALQRYFIGPDSDFTYSTDVDRLVGDSALETFVLDTKTGYCEYYASAMAVMLRATGIPARVAVGFLSGRLTAKANPELGRDLNTYVVSTADAHAWVEVLFPGYGWVKFDPTPRSDGATLAPNADDLDPTLTLEEQRQGTEPEPEPTPTTSASPQANPNNPTDIPKGLGQDSLGGGTQTDRGAGWPIAVMIMGLLGLAGGGLALFSRRRREAALAQLGPTERVIAEQRRLHTAARRYGVGRAPAETSANVAARWSREGRTDPDEAARFAALTQAAAFGGDLPEDAADEAILLRGSLEDSLRGSVATRDRVLAPVRIPAAATGATAQEAWRRVRRALGDDED